MKVTGLKLICERADGEITTWHDVFETTVEDVIKKVMLKETVDGEFTTVDDVAQAALFYASFASNALTGQSMVVTHGWFME